MSVMALSKHLEDLCHSAWLALVRIAHKDHRLETERDGPKRITIPERTAVCDSMIQQ